MEHWAIFTSCAQHGAALITSKTEDLRDPKILAAPESQLMLSAGGTSHSTNKIQTYVWFSTEGDSWNGTFPVGDPGFWLWRMAWHKNICYAVAYNGNKSTRLYQSRDGKNFEVLIHTLSSGGYPNESAMVSSQTIPS